jgi:hypothetical protein
MAWINTKEYGERWVVISQVGGSGGIINNK